MSKDKTWIVERSTLGLYNLIRKETGQPDYLIAQNVMLDKAVEMLEKDAYWNERT